MQKSSDSSYPVSNFLCGYFGDDPFPNSFYFVGPSLFCLLVFATVVGTSLSIEWTIAALFRYAKKCRRRGFYEREKLRNPSHKIRVRTTRSNPIPTPKEVMEQWEVAKRRNNNLEKIRLGAMLADIESTVDNALVRDENGDIVGRHPGLKGWLRHHCRKLLPHYKTLMRYKSMADKMQKIGGLRDPDPVIVVLPEGAPKRGKTGRKRGPIENSAEQSQDVVEKEIGLCGKLCGKKMPEWAGEERFVEARKRVGKMLETPRTLQGLENELFVALGLLREKRPRESGYVRCGHRNRRKRVAG